MMMMIPFLIYSMKIQPLDDLTSQKNIEILKLMFHNLLINFYAASLLN